MQNRLALDSIFANCFYFAYCSKAKSQCPFNHLDKNYFNPVPPTYFIHLKNDKLFHLSNYTDIITNLKKMLQIWVEYFLHMNMQLNFILLLH